MKQLSLVVLSLLGLFCSVDALHAQVPSGKIPATTWCYPVTPFREAGVSNISSVTKAQAEVASEVHCRKQLVYEGPSRTKYFWSGVFWDTHFNKNQNPVFGTNYLDGKAWHLGFDFNGNSPGSTDMNEPVLAAANGYVEKVFHGDQSEAWGTVCVLKHYPTFGPSPVWTMYAHMATERCSNVGIGRFVKRGQQIGTIGDSDGWYDGGAHLHFEIWVDKPIEEFVDGELRKLRYLGWGYSHAAFNPKEPPGDRAEDDFYDRDHYTDPLTYIQARLPGSTTPPCTNCIQIPSSFNIAQTTPMVINNEPAIKLEWTPSDNVTTYRVTKYETATQQPLAVSHFQSTTEFTDTDVENGEEVRYEMEAINSMGTTVADNTLTITPNVILDVPEPFTLLTGGSDCLNWLPQKYLVWGTSFGAEHYRIERNAVPLASGIESREYADTDIVEGISYTYQVFATNNTGTTASNTVLVTIPVGTCDAPNSPSVTTLAATTITVNNAQLNVSVNPNGAGTSYFFEWGFTASYGNTTNPLSVGAGESPTTASFNVVVSCGNTYHFRAVAQSSGGTAYGADLTFTTPLCFVPAPSNLTALLNPDHTVDLTWTDNSPNEEAFFIYRTRQSTGGSSLNQLPPANTTSWTDDLSGLSDDTYCYTVAGWNQPTGTGPHSNEVCVTTPYGSVPPNTNTGSLALTSALNQYVSKTGASGLPTDNSPRTIEAWVRFDSLASQMFVVDMGSQTNDQEFGLAYKHNGTAYVGILDYYNGAVIGTSPFGFVTNTWYHFAITYDGTTVSWYVNGVLIDSTPSGKVFNTTFGDMVIGERMVGFGYFDGLVDEVRVWDVVRTVQEMNDTLNTELTGAEAGLVGYWKLNGDLLDSSVNGNHLTESNGASFSNEAAF